MSTTKINTAAVLNGNEGLPRAMSAVEAACRTVQGVYDRLDRKVLGRNDLADQLRDAKNRLEQVHSQIQQIHSTAEHSVQRYYTTDQTIRSWMP